MGDEAETMKKLRNWAEKHGLSQAQMAEKLGIQRGSLSHFYRGTRTPSAEICEKASKLMGPVRKKIAQKRVNPASPEELPFEVVSAPDPVVKAALSGLPTRDAKAEVPKKAQKRGRPKGLWRLVSVEDLEATRKLWGLSQRAMADRLGVSFSCYRTWLAGVSTPSVQRQERLKSLISKPTVPSPRPAPEQRPSTPGEIEATCNLVIAMIQAGYEMTGDELVQVTRGIMDGFKTPITGR